MNDKVFKEKVYGPYSDVWKILKIIQYAGQTSEDDEKWEMYMREIDRFSEKYKDNELAQGLLSFLVGHDDFKGAGDIIAKLNGGAA